MHESLEEKRSPAADSTDPPGTKESGLRREKVCRNKEIYKLGPGELDRLGKHDRNTAPDHYFNSAKITSVAENAGFDVIADTSG